MAVLALWGCAGDDSVAHGELAGMVSDDLTGRGVPGATVSFVSDALDRARTVTEPDGSFTLRVAVTDGVRFGTLEASRAGYADSQQVSVYFDGSSQRIELRLRAKH